MSAIHNTKLIPYVFYVIFDIFDIKSSSFLKLNDCVNDFCFTLRLCS